MSKIKTASKSTAKTPAKKATAKAAAPKPAPKKKAAKPKQLSGKKLLEASRKKVAADLAELERRDAESHIPEAVVEAPAATSPKPPRAAKEKTPGKLSAIDAAAQVLATSGQPMNCKQMIDAMSSQGLWTSPGGKTPAATLYSAILREIGLKGDEARFVKQDRGLFRAR